MYRSVYFTLNINLYIDIFGNNVIEIHVYIHVSIANNKGSTCTFGQSHGGETFKRRINAGYE